MVTLMMLLLWVGVGKGTEQSNKISIMGVIISVKKNNLGKGTGMTGAVLI